VIRLYEATVNGDLCRSTADVHKQCFAKTWTPRDIADLLAKPGTGLMADENLEAERRIRGFILYRQAAGEAEILTLCTAPLFRRSDVARKLINALKVHLLRQDVKELFLEVEDTNLPALQLYRACGFKKIGHRKDYYGAGCHGVIMRFAESIDAS